MEIQKFGPPEVRDTDTDFDIYFLLNKAEAEAITKIETKAAIAAALVAEGGPFGAAAAVLINEYLNLVDTNTGPNGCSVKMTIRQGLGGLMQMKEFIAQPI